MRKTLTILLLGALATTSLGCNKLKSIAGGGDDGGAESAGSGKSLSQLLNGFEGEIGIHATGKSVSSGGAPLDLTLAVKGDKLRAELPASLAAAGGGGGGGMQGHVIVRSDEKKLFFVQDAQKQAIVVDLNKAGEQLAKVKEGGFGMGAGKPAAPVPSQPPKITKTGKTDTVVGQKCENWDIEDMESHQKVQVCVAEQGVSWFRIPFTGAPPEMAWAGELLDGKHFPLRAIVFDKAGAEESRIEVSRLDKKTLPDTQFQVPPDYKQVDLAQLMSAGFPGGQMPGQPPPGFPGKRPPRKH